MTPNSRQQQPGQPRVSTQGQAPQPGAQDPEQERERIGGFVGKMFPNLTRDSLDRISLALMAQSSYPTPGMQMMMQGAQQRIGDRRKESKAAKQQNKTIEALRKAGVPERELEIAMSDPAYMKALLGQVAQKRMGANDPNVQSSQPLPDNSGAVQIMRNGNQRVVTAGGEVLTGEDAMEFVRKAQETYTNNQRSIYGARTEGTNLAETETGGAAAAAQSIGGKQGQFVEDAFNGADAVSGSLRNINTAISALDAGAKSGAIERYIPNITETSATLNNAMDRMGLDVIGSVTFGALSEAELRLAMETAVPRNLDEPALRSWLVNKREAQRKVRVALMEQARFLSDPNNSLNDWARQVEGTAQSEIAQPNGEPQSRNKRLRFNPETGDFE